MSGSAWNYIILTLVTFIPTAGAILLLFFPRRHRDIRWFALAISLITFVLSLHLPVCETPCCRLSPLSRR